MHDGGGFVQGVFGIAPAAGLGGAAGADDGNGGGVGLAWWSGPWRCAVQPKLTPPRAATHRSSRSRRPWPRRSGSRIAAHGVVRHQDSRAGAQSAKQRTPGATIARDQPARPTAQRLAVPIDRDQPVVADALGERIDPSSRRSPVATGEVALEMAGQQSRTTCNSRGCRAPPARRRPLADGRAVPRRAGPPLRSPGPSASPEKMTWSGRRAVPAPAAIPALRRRDGSGSPGPGSGG